jgi:hypothetical protein
MTKNVKYVLSLISPFIIRFYAAAQSEMKRRASQGIGFIKDFKKYPFIFQVNRIKTFLFVPEHRSVVITFLIISIMTGFYFSVQTRGSVLPVDRDVIRAFSILQSTSTGRRLVEKVRNSTRGSYIYLTIGNTEKDNLMDECGEKVRGLTRVDFRMTQSSCSVRRVTVITNRDLVGSDVYEIVKSLAFELENVCQVFNLNCACPWRDSPDAPLTQARVLEELGIIN